MSENTPERRTRIAAALENQFEACNAAAAKLLADMSGAAPDYYNMPIAIALLRTSGQLGAAIARLEPAKAPSPEKSETHGSITK